MKKPNQNRLNSISFHFLLLGGLSTAQTSLAANYYVASTGTDTNPGTLSAPMRTIGAAQNKLAAGDTLFVRGGTYFETVRISRSGTARNPIEIRAYPGETPTLDGRRELGKGWGTMVNLAGNYIHFDGFEVKDGLGQGVVISGHHNTLSNANVHDHADRGVLAAGDYSVVERTKVWGNVWYNCRLSSCPPTRYPNGGSGAGLSAARDPADGITENVVLRGNTVYNNWGEGLSTFEADGTTIEGNVVYDNYKVNIYVSDSRNVVVANNLAYVSSNPYVGRVTSVNIGMADERGKPFSSNIRITNNFVKGGVLTLGWWFDPDLPTARMDNVLIAHNTFVNAHNTSQYSASINLKSAAHRDVRFVNNIVTQDTVAACVKIGNGDITFSSNLYSKPPAATVRAWNDVIGNPRLALAGSTWPGQMRAEYFKLTNASPAIGAAAPLSTLLDDYFGNPRDTTPDIGGHEF